MRKSAKDPHFYQQVYEVCCAIPEGRVSTYGAIADFLALGSARMVGWALKQSIRTAPHIPAHRVVNRKGELSGRMSFDPPESMAELLRAEGVKVRDQRVVEFDRLYWHPEEGLGDANI